MLNVLDSTKDTAPMHAKSPSSVEVNRMRVWLEERIAKGKKEPHAEVVALTPVLAALLLERNPVNRPIGKYNAETLRADVAGGRFTFNGESIVVSNTGVLLDGQHRCSIVIETRATITTVMVFGPKEEARYTIDIGKPKTAANFLHMKGFVDTNNMAAVVALLLEYGRTQTLTHGGSARATKTEIVNAAHNYPGLEKSILITGGATKQRLGSRSVLAFCHYLFKRKAGAEAADEFMRLLIDNDGLRKGSAIHTLRRRLEGFDRGIRADQRAEVIFKCWNAWRRGEAPTSVKVTGKLPKLEK